MEVLVMVLAVVQITKGLVMIAKMLAPPRPQPLPPPEPSNDRAKPVPRGRNEPHLPPPPFMPDVRRNNLRVVGALLLTAVGSAFLAVAGVKYWDGVDMQTDGSQQAGFGTAIEQPPEGPGDGSATDRKKAEETPVVAPPPTEPRKEEGSLTKPQEQVKAKDGLHSIPRLDVPFVKLIKDGSKNPEGTLTFEAGGLRFMGKNGGNQRFHDLRLQSFSIEWEGPKIAVYIGGQLTYRVLPAGTRWENELKRLQRASELLHQGK